MNLPSFIQKFFPNAVKMRTGGPAALMAVWLPFFVFNSSVHAGMLVGHRGGTASRKPENTLSSFEYAYQKGATHVECDLRTTADGVIVIMHDPTVDRTTSGHGAINDLSFAQARTFDAGARFGVMEGKGVIIPTLKETLQLAKAKGKGVFLDIKEGGLAAQVRREVDEVGLSEAQVVFVNSTFDLLREYRRYFPTNVIFLIAGASGTWWAKSTLEWYRNEGVSGFLFWGGYQSPADIAAMHSAGMKIMIINGGLEGLYEMTEGGIDGIMTDWIEICSAGYREKAWEKWAQDAGLSPGQAKPDADVDGDGLTNFAEYSLGSDPLDAGSKSTTLARLSSLRNDEGVDGGTRSFYVEFRPQKLPTFEARQEISNDQLTWTTVPDAWQEKSEFGTRARIPASAAAATQWIRVVLDPIR